MENKLIKCSRIGVDCVVSVDIRCGGREHLVFNFDVK